MSANDKEEVWTLEHKHLPIFILSKKYNMPSLNAFFEVKYKDVVYGVFGEKCWDKATTKEILDELIFMLNDAHALALEDAKNET